MSILNGEVDAGKELFELPVMIKADVQGSEQALSTALRYEVGVLLHVQVEIPTQHLLLARNVPKEKVGMSGRLKKKKVARRLRRRQQSMDLRITILHSRDGGHNLARPTTFSPGRSD